MPITTELERPATDEMNEKQIVRRAIINLMRYHPRVSKSMVSIHVATYKTKWGISWSGILDELVDEGIVTRMSYLQDNGRASSIYFLTDQNQVVHNLTPTDSN